jgi:hypothetical protein
LAGGAVFGVKTFDNRSDFGHLDDDTGEARNSNLRPHQTPTLRLSYPM